MKMRSFFYSVLTLVTALAASAPDVRATPKPGRYVGALRITKTLPPYYTNALSVTTAVRIVAEVIETDSGRKLNILAAVAEPPVAAFNTENSVIRGSFSSDGSCIIHGPPLGGSPGPSDYLGAVTEQEAGFTIRHDNIPIGVDFFVDPHSSGPITDFVYTLRRLRQ